MIVEFAEYDVRVYGSDSYFGLCLLVTRQHVLPPAVAPARASLEVVESLLKSTLSTGAVVGFGVENKHFLGLLLVISL